MYCTRILSRYNLLTIFLRFYFFFFVKIIILIRHVSRAILDEEFGNIGTVKRNNLFLEFDINSITVEPGRKYTKKLN